MSVLAVVAKPVFEQQAKRERRLLAIGEVWPTDRYASANPRLAPVADGGSLYLCTMRPGDQRWLVAVLTKPAFDDDHEAWIAADNATPIADITPLVGTWKLTREEIAAEGHAEREAQALTAANGSSVELLAAPTVDDPEPWVGGLPTSCGGVSTTVAFRDQYISN